LLTFLITQVSQHNENNMSKLNLVRPKIGAHVSVAGGLFNGFINAKQIGAEAIQIFGGSPRMWRCRLQTEAELQKYFEARKLTGIEAVYLHASYLVNLGSDKGANRENSVLSLIDHLAIAEQLEARGLIFHMGSSMAGTKEEALQFTIVGMKEVLKQVPGKSWLILENSAGGGNKLGLDFAEVAAIIEGVGSPRVKVCLDTAHIFEAGGIDEYSRPKVKKLFDDFEAKIGLDKLVALHINDSKTPYNSHHDRHENIGDGHIGLEGFRNLASDKRLYDKDWLLEVPGMDNTGPDAINIERLKQLFK
jgi:apurinic endonuclease APN1